MLINELKDQSLTYARHTHTIKQSSKTKSSLKSHTNSKKMRNYKGLHTKEWTQNCCSVNKSIHTMDKRKKKKKFKNKQPTPTTTMTTATRERGLFTDCCLKCANLACRNHSFPPIIHMYTPWIIHSELNAVYTPALYRLIKFFFSSTQHRGIFNVLLRNTKIICEYTKCFVVYNIKKNWVATT